MKQIFENIYHKNLWGNLESRSGPGSTLTTTTNLRSMFPELIKNYNIKSILDAPCGDLNWMSCLFSELEDVDYIGGDTVIPLILKNKLQYSSRNRKFIEIDLTRDKLPKADLLVSRDFLFHLSYTDIQLYFDNLFKSDIKFLLTTTHVNDGKIINSDIKTGDWRLIDLFSDPFNLPKDPLEEIIDCNGTKKLCLWKVVDIYKGMR